MSPQNHRAAVAGRWWHAPILPRLAKNVYGGTRTRRFEEFGAWQRTKFEAQLNINWKIGRRLGVRGYGSRIQECDRKLGECIRCPAICKQALPIDTHHQADP